MNFSQILKKLMEQRTLTNYQLAKDLDIHPTTVANWLNGKVPRKKTLSVLAAYFDVSVDHLLGNEQEKKPVTSESGELQDEFIAYYGEVKPYLDDRDINDLKIFMKAKADYKRKKQNDEGGKD